MLKYRVLQFSVFVLLILSVLFLFNACNKDAVTNDESIQSRTDMINTQVEIQESYNAFSQKRQSVQKCDECYTNPLYYDIELQSGRIVDYEDNMAVLFKVKDSPFQYTTWERNQILVKKDGEGNYSFSNLIFLADSSFYTQKKYKPLSIIFTGVILEINQENVFQNAFLLSQGETLDKIDKSEFNRYFTSSNNLDLRDDDDIYDTDWNWGDGGDGCPPVNKSHFWRNLRKDFNKIFEKKKGNKNGGKYDYSWVGGFKHGYQGGTNFGFGNNENSSGGGGSTNFINKPLCEDLAGFWAQLKASTKISFNEALENVATKLNVGLCGESYTNTDYCPTTPYEIFCNSIYSDCFDGDMSVEITEEQFEECLTKVLTPFANTNLSPACLKAVESFTFNNTYGLNVNPFFLNAVMCGFGTLCGNQEEFNEEALESYAENLIENYNKNNTSDEYSGFHSRTLSCESFNFVPQSVGDGQIACVSGLYLSKDFGGVYSYTPQFCIHFTLPKIRYNGQIIPKGQAADCAAWAANAAAAIVGMAFQEQNYQMSDAAMKVLFKVTFNLKMKQTSCGYGAAIDCEFANCLGPETTAKWNDGFFDWIEEQFFGCN